MAREQFDDGDAAGPSAVGVVGAVKAQLPTKDEAKRILAVGLVAVFLFVAFVVVDAAIQSAKESREPRAMPLPAEVVRKDPGNFDRRTAPMVVTEYPVPVVEPVTNENVVRMLIGRWKSKTEVVTFDAPRPRVGRRPPFRLEIDDADGHEACEFTDKFEDRKRAKDGERFVFRAWCSGETGKRAVVALTWDVGEPKMTLTLSADGKIMKRMEVSRGER